MARKDANEREWHERHRPAAELTAVKCSLCDGAGSYESSMWGPEDCERCGGSGAYDVSLPGRDEPPAHPFACDDWFAPDRRRLALAFERVTIVRDGEILFDSEEQCRS